MKTPLSRDYFYTIITSPVGELKLVASDAGLAAVTWVTCPNDKPNKTKVPDARENAKHPILAETQKQLTEYFAGKRTKFDLKLDMEGTPFQKSVWKTLLAIPYGETVSYTDVAKKVGKPKAVRAVGNANNRNPICIIAACHRVVASSGDLAGYAGGIEAKKALLALESAT
ncbi:MAG TPA: methylated-DNA--[protein]-cysteine S-methyltransferase [Candidatus Paceibacterota bacterium]